MEPDSGAGPESSLTDSSSGLPTCRWGLWKSSVTAELLPLTNAVGRVLLGKEKQVRLAFSCLLAGGHLLIEDRPGMGKSTLAEALATVFSLAFKRVSFTSDLLPADLTGINAVSYTHLRAHETS